MTRSRKHSKVKWLDETNERTAEESQEPGDREEVRLESCSTFREIEPERYYCSATE
jgi:hypothetical protein